jgi:PPM family protein phosphatase
MRVVAGVATDIGRVREGNEDSFLVEPPLYAVADGMGGARGGEVASQLALTTVEEGFAGRRGPLALLIHEANAAVFARSTEDRSVAGMGTTLTGALVEGDHALLVHVGDSRAYLLRGGQLRQLTVDHTLVQRMIDAGEISADEADVHPHRNVLLRVLGTEPDVDVDETELGLLEGDRLLLCSDGLTGMITDEQIQAILEAASGPQEAADRLVRAANRAGGIDNITVLILDLVEGDEEPAVDRPRMSSASTTASSPPGPDLRRFVKPAIAVVAVAVVLLAGYTALRSWLDTRWYLGVSNGHVAIFQGIPAEILGLQLSEVDLETEISALDVEALPLYADLPDGINVESRDEALARVEQMRTDLAAAAPVKGGNG